MKNKNLKTKVSFDNIPAKPFNVIFSAMTLYLFLDKFNAPAWLFITLGLLWLLVLITSITISVQSEYVDVFEEFEKWKASTIDALEKLKTKTSALFDDVNAKQEARTNELKKIMQGMEDVLNRQIGTKESV